MRHLLIPALVTLSLGACSKPAPPPAAEPAAKATAAVADWKVYVCDDGRIVRAAYPDINTAKVELAGRTATLTVAMSASGARYVGEGLQWWTKGDDGRLSVLKAGEEIAADAGVTCLPPERAPVEPPAPGTPGGLPDDRTPLDERPAAPGSSQAAGTVVETYYALIGDGRVAETAALRADGKAEDLSRFAQLHAQVGKPGAAEGGCGSMYVEVPVVLYGRYRTGAEYHASGKATLRRVNDVPGATAEQLRWRIMQVDVVERPSGARPTG